MNAYDRLAELLKVLAHPVRLKILDILCGGEQCVCYMEAALHLRQAYVSQQLSRLRKAGLVADRKDGLRVYYRITDRAVMRMVDQARSILQRQGVTLPVPDLRHTNALIQAVRPRPGHIRRLPQARASFLVSYWNTRRMD